MQSIEIQKGINVGMEDLISGVSKLETPVLEKFMSTVGNILKSRKTASASERENAILRQMDSLVPAFAKQRYELLQSKLRKATISEKEHEELQQIVDFMEERAVERVYLMAELAAIRKVSLKELAEQFRSKRLLHAAA